MRQIQTQLADEINTLLIQSSSLVDKYENKNVSFVESFKEWLIKGEELLKRYNKPQVSELAGLRSVTIAAERGVYDKNINIISAKSNRKISSSIAAISLNKAQNILQNVLKPVLENIEHAKNLIKQILVTAAQKNLINKYWLTDEDLSTKLQNLWKAFKEDTDLKALTNHVLTLVSYVDALRLMEEILDEWTNTSSQ
jgi:hypothetical protein